MSCGIFGHVCAMACFLLPWSRKTPTAKLDGANKWTFDCKGHPHMDEDARWCFLGLIIMATQFEFSSKQSISLCPTLEVRACCGIVLMIYGNVADGVSSQRRDRLMFPAKITGECLLTILWHFLMNTKKGFSICLWICARTSQCDIGTGLAAIGLILSGLCMLLWTESQNMKVKIRTCVISKVGLCCNCFWWSHEALCSVGVPIWQWQKRRITNHWTMGCRFWNIWYSKSAQEHYCMGLRFTSVVKTASKGFPMRSFFQAIWWQRRVVWVLPSWR